ncbi:uncharacterized protein BT62DRAFT_923889 [Guyanagaster necrorhizus]|uniref:Uncharacterized protein n=1 Tax=Guyanagaster necrorhizus TaxID=856835 RepID=A0A9P7VIL4_9AGAR|nr:uncharacterized protein BT62DRAFT_923889 [Guyanagaster necrorhizus MCA 3950]KAG7440711.1 hypothetical protein BT62DRAFT_923889 [Guyanagaster necrorhizus MCA 3950]
MPALWNIEEWGEREDEEEIMAIIEREEREKQKEMDMQEREDRILQERREEEESSEDEVEPDIRRQITDERKPITMEGNRGMLLGEPIVSPNEKQPAKKIGHVPWTACAPYTDSKTPEWTYFKNWSCTVDWIRALRSFIWVYAPPYPASSFSGTR